MSYKTGQEDQRVTQFIRALHKATADGVDALIDKTPDHVLVAALDVVEERARRHRREILTNDGTLG